ncbi:YtxH domain-containing protein [Vagococcus entomophilus]|uniref:YtxH domain-containing protein n=1 Tax=Vagococcus entomophilus TaxID=1160095 RepID=A0A430AGI0_9ENTE|nr:YtxH domain-containing protein [Vagococcus entomophilus]RSU06964.1 hypothetical protein CBF30_06805 [Vagococcus entomophilus]
MSLGRFVKGLILGATVGGSIGLLFAPRSGNATRQKLARNLDDATQTTKDLDASLKNFQESLVHLKQTSQELLPTFKEETNKSLADFQFQATPRIKAIQRQSEKIKQDLTIEE